MVVRFEPRIAAQPLNAASEAKPFFKGFCLLAANKL